MKNKNLQYLNIASWCTGIIAVIAGAVAMQALVMSMDLLAIFLMGEYLRIGEQYFLITTLVNFIIAIIMLGNAHKLSKKKRVRRISYYFPVLVLLADFIMFLQTGLFTSFEMVVRCGIPLIAIVGVWFLSKVDWNDERIAIYN